MKTKHILVIFLSLFLSKSQAKFKEYYNYGASVNLSVMDNFAYGASTSPNRLFVSGSLNYGASLNDEFNLLIGLDFGTVSPNNATSDYKVCDGSPSCDAESHSFQFFLPIGFEYYTNTNRSKFQSFYVVNVIPAFSVTESVDITPYDINHIAQPTYTNKDNGFKFQNLYLSIGVNNEFGLSQKFKIFIEPSMKYSLLFKREDVVNPAYMLCLKIGCKFRTMSK